MTLRKTSLLLALAAAGLFASCGGKSSSTGGGAGGGGGGGGLGTLAFAGPGNATPTSQTDVLIEWLLATLDGSASSDVTYDVYRSTDLALSDEQLISSLAGGSTSYLDAGLADGASYFYRVVAKASDGQNSDNGVVVSSHLPSIPPTPADYATDVEPAWSRLDDGGTQMCIDCHEGTIATLDLTSWEGVMIGVGTAGAPDSFVIPGEPGKSFQRAVSRIVSNPALVPLHKGWASQAPDFDTILSPWIEAGATPTPDTTMPTFAASDLADPALYKVERVDAANVAVTFPHASDPESTPYSPTGFDHVRYHVYGGADANSIDWDNPVATVGRTFFPSTDTTFTVQFAWSGAGVFVVRPLDYALNEGINEAELILN